MTRDRKIDDVVARLEELLESITDKRDVAEGPTFIYYEGKYQALREALSIVRHSGGYHEPADSD